MRSARLRRLEAEGLIAHLSSALGWLSGEELRGLEAGRSLSLRSFLSLSFLCFLLFFLCLSRLRSPLPARPSLSLSAGPPSFLAAGLASSTCASTLGARLGASASDARLLGSALGPRLEGASAVLKARAAYGKGASQPAM